MSGAAGGGGTDRAALLARIRAALRSRIGSEGDDSDISDLPSTAFSEVPQSAYDALAARLDGTSANGQPVADLFADAGDDAANRAAVVMLNGLSQGPLAIAQNLAQVLQMSQGRAETIARNELVSSYRDAQMANYRVNSDVVGSWMWSAAIASACICCVDMDGTVHSMDEDLIDHVMGRCEPLPITRSWDDIMRNYGLSADGIPETSITESYGTGRDWFFRQDDATQIGVMGPAKWIAWQNGDISLDDLVGVREDGAWGGAVYERSLKELGLDAQDYLPAARERGLGPQGREAIEQARAAIPEQAMVRVDLGNGMFTYMDPLDARQFDTAANMAGRDTGWQNIDDVLAKMRGEKPGEGELELREPKTATAKTAYTEADLKSKTMADLRQIARDAGVTPARTKAETIDRILAKSGVNKAPAAERVAALRREIDEKMAEREALYDQQHDLVAEKDKLENQRDPQRARYAIESAERRAQMDLYHQSLSDNPAAKDYLKAIAAHDKATAAQKAAKAEQDRLERVMARLSNDKTSAAYQQAKADYDAAVAAQQKAEKAIDKAWGNLWKSSPGIYKPEIDSIGGRDMHFNPITHYDRQFRPIRTPMFTPEQIANHPLVLQAKQDIKNLDKRLAEVEKEIKGLDKPIKDINKQIDKQLAQMRDLQATLREEGGAVFDTMRPFSDVIELPEGRQPPNATMEKLDFRMHEPRGVTKSRIIDNVAKRLKDNPDWQAYVERAPKPRLGETYHSYIGEYATAKDTKNAQHVADWIKKWGVGYRPGSAQWVSMQMAVRDEFGLDAAIHSAAASVSASISPSAGIDAAGGAAERFYAENGAALRAFMRAMYDNTQAWFAENGITELELYRGFGWKSDADFIPHGVNWGPLDNQNYGVTDIELNPFQSFSADINISQGTGGAAANAGFAGGGFGGGSDYSLLIGAKVPVDRILSTAQTGFGAKLESEIVVMGRATDTVAYRAGTRVESALLREADVQAVGDREMVYSLADGTTARVVANVDGTFTLTYQDGPQAKLGSFKVGGSKSYKTEKGVNNALKAMRFSNTYVAPDLSAMEIREGLGASGFGAAEDGLAARIDSIPADVTTVPDIQDWLKEQIPALQQVDLMGLDAPTARLVANASANLIGALPEVGANLGRIAATNLYSDAVALVPRDGLSLLLNTDKWLDLEGLAARSAKYAADGWWVGASPEEIIGHEIGHALQINYGITNDTWLAAMERVYAAGGNPLVTTYAADKVEESFAETFALVVYGEPTDAQLPIAREMAQLLSDNGIDYKALRAAVGVSPLDLS